MKYLLLIYSPYAEATGMEPDAAAMEPWNGYTQWLTERGINRGGARLAPSATATTVRIRDGQRLTTDGPFAETKEVLGGYFIVECDDLDLALEAAARCPGAAWGSIEVRPLIQM